MAPTDATFARKRNVADVTTYFNAQCPYYRSLSIGIPCRGSVRNDGQSLRDTFWNVHGDSMAH